MVAAEVWNVLFRAAKEAFRHHGKGFSASLQRLSCMPEGAFWQHGRHEDALRKRLYGGRERGRRRRAAVSGSQKERRGGNRFVNIF